MPLLSDTFLVLLHILIRGDIMIYIKKNSENCRKKRCPYPLCMLGQSPQKADAETKKIKNFLELPFPEDDV